MTTFLKNSEIAKALVTGANADIWYDASQLEDAEKSQTIDHVQASMVHAANRLQSLDDLTASLKTFFDQFSHLCSQEDRDKAIKALDANHVVNPGAWEGAWTSKLTTNNTGGGCMVDLVHLKDGRVVGISDEVVAVYFDEEAFWDGSDADNGANAIWLKTVTKPAS